MPTPIAYIPKVGSKWVDFGSGGHSAAWYAAVAASGCDGVFLDTYSATASDAQLALQADLGVMIFQGFDAAAWADPTLAVSRAKQLVNFAKSIGYPQGLTAWLDFESCSLAYASAAAWINAWSQAVRSSGYFPGLYVGAPEPLSGLQLYGLLTGMMHYWESESKVPTVARRGYQVIQEQGNVMLHGVLVDTDRIQMDALGGLPHGMILPRPKPKPTPKPSPIQTADATIATLKKELAASQAQVKTLEDIVDRVRKDVQGG